VTFEEWALVACVVFTALWSGLFGMLNLVLHPMLARMSGAEFARFMALFLPTARTAAFNYVEVAGMVISPIVAIVAGVDGTVLVLTVIGLALTIAGPLLVSNRAAEPNYDVILSWDPEALPRGWEAVRHRYFALNWIRAVATWTAFGLFFAALLVSLG
jgi:hypothetical protein